MRRVNRVFSQDFAWTDSVVWIAVRALLPRSCRRWDSHSRLNWTSRIICCRPFFNCYHCCRLNALILFFLLLLANPTHADTRVSLVQCISQYLLSRRGGSIGIQFLIFYKSQRVEQEANSHSFVRETYLVCDRPYTVDGYTCQRPVLDGYFGYYRVGLRTAHKWDPAAKEVLRFLVKI